MTGWFLTLLIEGSKVPDVEAGPYKSSDACFMAGALMKAADIAAKGEEKRYTTTCHEMELPRVHP